MTGRPVTYAQTLSAATAIASGIRSSERDTVAVSTANPEHLLYTIWASILSGTSLVFCPDFDDPAQVHATLSESGAGLLLTDRVQLLAQDWAVPVERLLTAPLDRGSASGTVASLPVPTQADAGFLFQTSGTAGEPKWVHCAFMQCGSVIECMLAEGALDHATGQTVYLTPPLFHSYGLSAMLEYTRAGSAIVLPSSTSPLGPVAELRDPGLAARVTAIEGVPDLHSQLARLIGRLSLRNLRHIGFGGGALEPDAVAAILEHHPEITVSVRYGLTETPSVVTHKLFRPGHEADWRSSGLPLSIYGIRIETPQGDVLGPGLEGEIVVSGAGVARYFRSGVSSAQRTLRTGDIGYLTPGGELVVVGRHSAFLKFRGYRLSPEQIESAIRSFDGIEDCRVLMRDGRLAAELVSQAAPLPTSALVTHIKHRLPSYAVPEQFIKVDSIPRTRSGKIKRH